MKFHRVEGNMCKIIGNCFSQQITCFHDHAMPNGYHPMISDVLMYGTLGPDGIIVMISFVTVYGLVCMYAGTRYCYCFVFWDQ